MNCQGWPVSEAPRTLPAIQQTKNQIALRHKPAKIIAAAGRLRRYQEVPWIQAAAATSKMELITDRTGGRVSCSFLQTKSSVMKTLIEKRNGRPNVSRAGMTGAAMQPAIMAASHASGRRSQAKAEKLTNSIRPTTEKTTRVSASAFAQP